MFFRLADWRAVLAAPSVEVRHGLLSTFIETEGGRVSLCVGTALDAARAQDVLESLLACATPETTGGLPVRAFQIGDDFYVSCTLPEGSGAHLWLRVHRVLRRLLEAHLTPA